MTHVSKQLGTEGFFVWKICHLLLTWMCWLHADRFSAWMCCAKQLVQKASVQMQVLLCWCNVQKLTCICTEASGCLQQHKGTWHLYVDRMMMREKDKRNSHIHIPRSSSAAAEWQQTHLHAEEKVVLGSQLILLSVCLVWFWFGNFMMFSDQIAISNGGQ